MITGASRTGKSAIIPLIDYCLASTECNVPIDVIRDYASWYGVAFQTQSEQILIARAVPKDNKVSSNFYVTRAKEISVPPVIETANENPEGVKNILNTISNVPYFSLEGEFERKAYQARLGFRDLVALVFQSQDIVANQNILFYKTHAHEHRERLRNWLPFILGAENIEVLKARQELQELEQRLKALERDFERAKAHSKSWSNNLQGQLRIAQQYGLLDRDPRDVSDPDELILIARQLVQEAPNYSIAELSNFQKASQALIELDKEEDDLSQRLAKLRKRLDDVKQLKTSLTEYSVTVKRRSDRLHISNWLTDLASDAKVCPLCGSDDHPRSSEEMSRIASVFEEYEAESKRVEEIPTSFDREEERLNKELESLIEEQRILRDRYDTLFLRDQKTKEEFQKAKTLFLFLGHLKASVETFEKLQAGGELEERIATLVARREHLLQVIDPKAVERRLSAAKMRISQYILNYLQTLDVEAKYRETPPSLNVKDLNMQVISTDRNWHYLSEIGSASNWVSFHLALICALQKFFLEQSWSVVPSFAVFDQPSQVYFPKVKSGEEVEEEDSRYDDEDDEQAVRQIFRTLADAVAESDGEWQAIILDHADKSIYGEIGNIHEVEEWRAGRKLIPSEWYQGA